MAPTKAPVLLDKPDDWWTWSAYIKGLAKRRRVWKYIDPDDETNTIDEPVEPTMPIPAKPFAQMDSNDRWAWQQESKLYDWSYKIYEQERNGMTAIWTAIHNTVSEKHRRILNLDISERQRMVKLRDKLKPDELSRRTKLMYRFRDLGAKKHNESMEEWLNEWENVVGECEDAGLTVFTGYATTLKFIESISPLLPVYAEIRRAELNKDTTLSIFKEINAFRHEWESELCYENQSSRVSASSQGQSDQSNRSSQPRKCICGDFHPFIDCPYIISSKRSASWKADPKIEAKFEKIKKTRENVKVAIERAVERADQEARAIRTFL